MQETTNARDDLKETLEAKIKKLKTEARSLGGKFEENARK